MLKVGSLTLLAVITLITSFSYRHGSSNKENIRLFANKGLEKLRKTFKYGDDSIVKQKRVMQDGEEGIAETMPEEENKEKPEEAKEEAEEAKDKAEEAKEEEEEHFREMQETGEHKLTPGTTKFWIYFFISIFLVLYAGIMSGLTVGFMGISVMDLEIKLHTGDEETKRRARKILPVLKKHHLLLVTLLVNNAIAMEALPIFLDAMVPSWLAILLSTTFVLIFGEVVPQAICTGAKQIKIAAAMAPLITCLMYTFCFITIPLSKALDCVLGVHGVNRFHKKDLKALIGIHVLNEHNEDGLTTDEVRIIQSTIDLREMKVTDIMVKNENVVLVPSNKKITERLIEKVSKCGYSRIPIYTNSDKNNIYGALVTKSLLGAREEIGKELTESSCTIEAPLVVCKDTNLLEMLSLFQQKRTRIAMVTDEEKKTGEDVNRKATDSIMNIEFDKTKILGLVAQTDLFEKLIKQQLTDNDIHQRFNLMSGDGFMKYNSTAMRNQMRNQRFNEAEEEDEFEMEEVNPLERHLNIDE